jgi:hypothetical protein
MNSFYITKPLIKDSKVSLIFPSCFLNNISAISLVISHSSAIKAISSDDNISLDFTLTSDDDVVVNDDIDSCTFVVSS